MSTVLVLTGEQADIEGYLRLKLGGRSENPSMIRSITGTLPGGSLLTDGLWITDPLDAASLTAADWGFYVWAKESDVLANAGLQLQIWKFTANGGEVAQVLNDVIGTELSTSVRSTGRTTVPATATSLADGDRLVARILSSDVGTMAAGYTIQLSYNGQRARVEGDSYIVCPDELTLTAETPESTRQMIRQLLLDTSVHARLSREGIDQAWDSALREYSQDRPYILADDYDGDGRTWEFEMPRKWIMGSSLLEIEYPADTSLSTRNILEDEDWEIVRGALGPQPTLKIRFPTIVPEASTGVFKVRYTTRHIHTDEEDTVPPEDLDAIAALAVSYACTTLAAEAASTDDPTLRADSVQHRDSAQIWQSIAKDFRARYTSRIQTSNADGLRAASITRDWDIQPSVPGQSFMFHSARWR